MLEKKTRHTPVRVRDPGSQGPCPLSFSCLIRCQGRPPKEQLILHRRRHQSLQQVWHHQSVKRRRSGASKPCPLFRLAYCRRDIHTNLCNLYQIHPVSIDTSRTSLPFFDSCAEKNFFNEKKFFKEKIFSPLFFRPTPRVRSPC